TGGEQAHRQQHSERRPHVTAPTASCEPSFANRSRRGGRARSFPPSQFSEAPRPPCQDLMLYRRPVPPIIAINGLTKTYASGFAALRGIDLEIQRGEIFALLGPNGAGKTTLISVVCGIVTPSSGTVLADGHDIVRDYRRARAKIGLVPQELTTDAF